MRDPIKTIKALLVEEINQEQPSYEILQHLQRVLMAYQKRAKTLSLQQMGEGEILSQDYNCTEDSITCGDAGTNYMTRPRHRDEREDQLLATMDGMVARSGRQDPMGTLLQAVPHLETLYPEATQRETVLASIREQINQRLQPQRT